jgi:ABC-type Fe3+ transport system permease subunit
MLTNFFFDYFYYRITQFYFKWDKRNSTTAILAIAMFQGMMIYNLFLIILRSYYTRDQTKHYSKAIALVGVLIIICFAIYNYRKYFNKYSALKSRWKDETRSHRIFKGILVLFCLILPWVIIIYVGIKY